MTLLWLLVPVLAYAFWRALRAGWQAYLESFGVPDPSSGDPSRPPATPPSAGGRFFPGPAATSSAPPAPSGREHP